MTTATQKRATKGGQVGVNGDFYEGGKFLPQTARPKTAPAPMSARVRKVQVEPFVWVESDRDPILCLVGTHLRRAAGDALRLEPNPAGVAYYGADIVRGGVRFGTAAEIADRFNAGERWL